MPRRAADRAGVPAHRPNRWWRPHRWATSAGACWVRKAGAPDRAKSPECRMRACLLIIMTRPNRPQCEPAHTCAENSTLAKPRPPADPGRVQAWCEKIPRLIAIESPIGFDIGESLSRCERLGKNQPGCEWVHTSLPNARIDSLQTDTPQVGRRAVPLTLSTPLGQIGELRPEEADTTGAEGKTRLQALLGEILARSQDLGLDDRQIAGVSRMYWDQASVTADQAVSDLVGLLSAEQFRVAIGQYARGPAVSALAEPDLPDKLDRLVNAAFDRATKDKSVVEIELAAKVADRLIGWAKTFAYFVAVPVAILFLILAVFGISKFEDVQKVADQANKILADATASLDKGQKNLASAEQKLASLTQSVADIEQTTRQNSDKLAQLKHYLPNNYIEDFLKTTNKTVSDVKRKLKEIGLYHGDIDDKVDDAMLAAIVAFQEKNNLPADGLLGMGTYLRLFGSDHGPSASNTSHPVDPAAQAAPSPAAVPAAPTAPGSGDAQTSR